PIIVLLSAHMFHKIKSAVEVVFLFHDLDVVRYQPGRETMSLKHLRHDRVMIRQRSPPDSGERTAPREYFDPINDCGERAQLKIRKAGAFPRQLVKVRRQHWMSANKSEMVVTKCIRTNDDDVHACCARPCSHRTRFSRNVSSSLELLSRK